jgi:hypothetical protein
MFRRGVKNDFMHFMFNYKMEKVMKKFLSMTLLLTAMFLTFSACSSDDDDFDYPMDTLYGSWEGISINVNGGWVNITEYPYTKFAFSINFNSDGTYSGRGYLGMALELILQKEKQLLPM